MNFFKIILALFLVILFVSCDPGSTIKYEIINTTNEAIKVKYQFVFNASGDTSSKETIISPKSSKILNQESTLGYVTHYDERHDSIFLYWLKIETQNEMTHKNFKDKKYWRLEKTDSQNGIYKLIVDKTLFND